MMSRFESRSRIEDDLVKAVDEVALLCSPGPYKRAGDDERLRIGAWQVHEALTCPAKLGATPLAAFDSSVQNVWRATAIESIGKLRDTPPGAFSEAYKRGDRDAWPWSWYRETATPVERAVVGQKAITFVSAAARLLDGWPYPSTDRARWSPVWDHPDRALQFAGRVDLFRRQNGSLVLFLIASGSQTKHSRTELAYEVLLALLAGAQPHRGVLVFPDVGERETLSVDVDDKLLAEGVSAAHEAAVAMAVQAGFSTGHLPRHPGRQCRWCPIQETCPDGSRWLSDSGGRRFGFRM